MLLIIAAALAVFSLPVITLTAQTRPSELFAVQEQAYLRMARCMEAVYRYKTALSIPIPDYDVCRTGMLGEPFNTITTTLGSLEAKRTTADPNMAALAVRMLHEAGLQKGDRVCAVFSGSFPSLNLAVLTACDAMGVEIAYISSVGASTYGANNPLLTFPEMAHRLYCEGLLLSDSVMVTAGGDGDVGIGMDERLLAEIKQKITAAGLVWFEEQDFAQNVSAKKDLLDSFSPDCFVSVGGNLSAIGQSSRFDSLGQGVLRPTVGLRLTDRRSGLVERYLAQGLPVLNLLNVKQLVAAYGLPFDPMHITPVGQSGIFFHAQYSKPLIVLALAAVCLPVVIYSYSQLRQRRAAKRRSEALLLSEEGKKDGDGYAQRSSD